MDEVCYGNSSQQKWKTLDCCTLCFTRLYAINPKSLSKPEKSIKPKIQLIATVRGSLSVLLKVRNDENQKIAMKSLSSVRITFGTLP